MAAGSHTGPDRFPKARRLALSVLTALLSLGKGRQVRGRYARTANEFPIPPLRRSQQNHLALIAGQGYGWADDRARRAGMSC